MTASASSPSDGRPAVGGVVILGETAAAAALARRLGGAAARVGEGGDGVPLAPGALLIDAAHPFARPLPERAPDLARWPARVRLSRRPWPQSPGDDWRPAADAEGAFAALRPDWRRVFLTLGQPHLAPFAADRSRGYLVRRRRGGAPPFAGAAVTDAPGPFSIAGEAELMRAARIDVLVTRNAGGLGAWPKVAAARALGTPVVMVAPPPLEPQIEILWSVDAALAWIARRRRP